MINKNGKEYMRKRIENLESQLKYLKPQLVKADAENRTPSFCMAAGISCKLLELVECYYVLFGERLKVDRSITE